MAKTLTELVTWLDSLTERASVEQLRDEVAELQIGPDLTRHIKFADGHYQRNLVHAGPFHTVWVMCWKNGQRSPIHDHARSTCAVRVLRGTLTETRFEYAPNGHIKPVASRDLPPEAITCAQDSDLHQISNLQAGDADLVTLHIYSPPLLRMGTYSLTDAKRGEDVWEEERRFVTTSPENSETPLESVQGWVTPNRLFFVRNHFPIPTIERSRWRLKIGGLVNKPREWTWEELTALPTRSLFATVECAGNGRSFLAERHPGVQWGAGAIGHAEWTGVSLHEVLNASGGVKAGATEVLFEGADTGTEPDHPERMNFARSLPMVKALHPDTLLVYRMNGELLDPRHGFPVRLFVPGWYGVASVKWLQRIEVRDSFYPGYFQTVKYTIQEQTGTGIETIVLGPMAVKAQMVRPTEGSLLGLGTHRLVGVAWAGEAAVAAVEVSPDGGRTWNPAELVGTRAPYCWCLWEYLWEVGQPGSYNLLVRAISEDGRVQPLQHNELNGGYKIHHSLPTRVYVEEAITRSTAFRGDLHSLLYDMNAYAEEMSRKPLDVEMEFSIGEGI